MIKGGPGSIFQDLLYEFHPKSSKKSFVNEGYRKIKF